jgi:hypothetical protein
MKAKKKKQLKYNGRKNEGIWKEKENSRKK